MKTSNKLLGALACILVIGMTSFTILLKAEYKKEIVRTDISKQVIKLKAFNNLDLIALDGDINVEIEEGNEYSIKNVPNAKVVGQSLKIDSTSEIYGKIIITVPKLPAISLQGYEISVKINGKNTKFANSTLAVNSTATGDLTLNNCDLTAVNIKTENAEVKKNWWGDWERYYHFHLNDSKVTNSDITLKGKATLSLKKTALLSPTFDLSDSASITVEGNAMNPFVKK
ncbi:hypothetical protein VB264_15845 [Arcicella aquatica]|uniref:Auto-transporter adhesin head GIN domain-containing protein n=1 Tax=Arcicella aquatica TaxID=217141 RepID=A0ABU5QR91_9BACT|nr:hypothetical protein [Arcicella aquatica]MEA5259270.1 hypothetical protein [Arcicella aquatica]